MKTDYDPINTTKLNANIFKYDIVMTIWAKFNQPQYANSTVKRANICRVVNAQNKVRNYYSKKSQNHRWNLRKFCEKTRQ